MMLSAPRCDYLTLTSFKSGDEFLLSVEDVYPKKYSEEGKRPGGYEGFSWDGLFVGRGKQKGKPHYMLVASGEGAETVLWRTRDIDCRCTRIDLQVTVWIPPKYEARKLYDILTSTDISWPGRRLTPTLVESGDGMDTIYVGSRTSERFARIYVKPDHKGKANYLRFEMEFKGAMATAVRRAIVEQYGSAKKILRSELDRLPFAASRSLRAFEAVLGTESHKVRPESVYGKNTTFDWLETQVEPAIIRLLHSHEHKERMVKLLDAWRRNV